MIESDGSTLLPSVERLKLCVLFGLKAFSMIGFPQIQSSRTKSLTLVPGVYGTRGHNTDEERCNLRL